MQLIGILLALLVVGWLVFSQLGDKPAVDANHSSDTQALQVPKVPQTLDGVPAFEQQMDDFMEQQNARRDAHLDDL